MIYHSFKTAFELIALYMTGIFILSLIKKDNSIVDVAYGVGFIVVSGGTLILFQPCSFIQFFITFLITVWGLRLSVRIYRRNKGKPEDFRYKKWREEWQYFTLRSFFQIYVLQGLIIIGVASVAIFTNGSSHTAIATTPFTIALVLLGTIVWCTGFFFEVIGDYQLDRFIKRQAALQASGQTPTTTIMNEGLWSLTRHPNYFGEVTMWWGLWIIAVAVPGAWVTIISPLIITFLLLKVSGIPMLEEKYKGNKIYEDYQSRTNAFFPWKKSL
jgi:steroid 5-alpha reductase family enzyme